MSGFPFLMFFDNLGVRFGNHFRSKILPGGHFSHSIFYTTFDLASEHVWFLFWMRFGSRFGPIFHNFCECPKTLKNMAVLYMAQPHPSLESKTGLVLVSIWDCVLTVFLTQIWLHLGSLLEPAGLILRIF